MSALLQFEFDRDRTAIMPVTEVSHSTYTEKWFRDQIVRHAVADTLQNGGTFVLVVSEKTVTVVQRAEADPL